MHPSRSCLAARLSWPCKPPIDTCEHTHVSINRGCDRGRPVEFPAGNSTEFCPEPTRLRLLALSAEEELSIGELAELLQESQPNVSRHAAALRQAGLLKDRREGTRTLVRVDPSVAADAVVADALASGNALCVREGSLARVADVVRSREEAAREFFSRPTKSKV